MSAENHNPSETSPPHSPTAFHHPTQTLASEEEDTEGNEKSSSEESLFPKDKKSLEEDQYLEEEEEEKYLKGKEYLHEQEYLKEEKYLQKEKHLEGREDLYENFLVDEFKAHSSQTPPDLKARVPTFFAVPAPISEPTSSRPPHGDSIPSTSSMKYNWEFLDWQDQSTQTEWIYESKLAPLKSKTQKGGSTMMLTTLKPDSPAMESASKRNFWDQVLIDPIGTLEGEVDSEDNVFTSSYQMVFRTTVKEMAVRDEMEEDIYIPLTGHLESETRRKLGILLKKNFEKYKEIILWIIKKREHLLNQRTTETTISFTLCHQPPKVEEPEKEEVKKPRIVRREKTLEIDTDWIKSKTKVHQGDGELILYPSETVFQILFSDGSGQIHYPSGHLAMLILSIKEGKFTCIILEDSEHLCIRALINNSGHATFYDENGDIWLSLSPNLGYYFAKGKHQKAWNWWDLNLHVHAPPVQSISLNINRYIKVHIRSQDKIIFHFIHQKKRICLNLGTRYKFISPEVLSEMKKKAILEMEISPTAQKIQILLGKMSRTLNILTIFDLKNFLAGSKIFPMRQSELEEKTSSSSLRQLPDCPTASSACAECFREVGL
ncbi:glutamate-rich protein 6B isoform X1 [Vicugna pacos]|uniref:Glutamate-rich protein 6B isoform X1 n=1 Tax=Vicugna pacos TaxID=30538 RepID=A0ABM5EGV4_VICPA